MTIADTDGKKNAEPSQNGTAYDLSDLRWMMQGVCDDFKQLEQIWDNLDTSIQRLEQTWDTGIQRLEQTWDTGCQQLCDKISAMELTTKTNSDTIAIHSKESNHSQRFDAIDAKCVSLENKIDTEIASVNSKLNALEDNLMAKLSVSHTASSIPSFAATTTVLSKDTTAVTSSEPIKIKQAEP